MKEGDNSNIFPDEGGGKLILLRVSFKDLKISIYYIPGCVSRRGMHNTGQ